MMGEASGALRFALALVTAAALAGCSPQAKARKILDRHESEFIECNEKLNQSMMDLRASLKAMAGGDKSGSQRSMDSSGASLDDGQACMKGVKDEIREEREAASIPDEVFEAAWDEWIKELEASGKLKREEF